VIDDDVLPPSTTREHGGVGVYFSKDLLLR